MIEREALIQAEYREFELNPFRTEYQMKRNIKEWIRMPDSEIIVWFNKFFSFTIHKKKEK